MQATTTPAQALRRLSELQTDGHRVLSVYLSFDPSEQPNLRERHGQLDALLDEAERRHGDGSHEQRMELRQDVERVRELLAGRAMSVQSAHGLAVFSSVGSGLLEVVALGSPVEPTVAVAQRPLIAPLLSAVPGERWCVALVSRRAARILLGDRDRLVEQETILDDVHRRHDQGGWSQARFQRGIVKEVDDHVRDTCAALLAHFRRHPFDSLLVGGPTELHQRVEDELHADLRALLAGRLEIDVERASVDEVHRKAAPLIDYEERRREREALARIAEGLAPGGHAAVGSEEVLGVLAEGRVQTLLLGASLDADVAERAAALAREQSAHVLTLRHDPDALDAHGEIAAILRF